MADKKKKADKPAETKPVEKPKRRSGKAYGKPSTKKFPGKTILGMARWRFVSEVLPKNSGKFRAEINRLDDFMLKALIEETVANMRRVKRDRRGHGKAGRYQNYLNGPGRPRSARDAELRRAAEPKAVPQHKTVSDGIKAAAVAASMIGEVRKTKSDAEVGEMIGGFIDDGLPISYISDLEI